MVTDYSDVKLETKDLILKKAEFEDWKTIYYNLWRHKESAKYMLWQPTETDEDAKDRMKRTIAFEEKPENKYALFVYLKKTGEAIGFAGMRELERGIYEETGIALGPEFVRKGYGRQILTALLEEAGKLGAKEFHACNRTGNAASRELQNVEQYIAYLKLAMQQEPDMMTVEEIDEEGIRTRLRDSFYEKSASILAMENNQVAGRIEYHFYG